MKVAYITHFLPSYRYAILDELAQDSKIELAVFCDKSHREGFDINLERDLDIKSFHSSVRTISILKKDLFFQKQILTKILKKEFDVIILSALKSDISVWLGLLLAFGLRQNVVLWGHCKFPKNIMSRKISQLMFSLSNSIIFYSEKEKEAWKSYYTIYNKGFVAKNTLAFKGLNEKLYLNKTEFNFKPNIPTGIFCGRLIANKNLDLLLEAINILKKEGQDFQMIIIGDGLLKNSLIEKSKKLGIQSMLHFTGAIFNNNILANYHRISNISIIPGHAGLAINLSFANSLPVITDDNFDDHPPEIHMIKDGETGFFYSHNNPHDLAEKIKAALLDLNKLKQMGSEALAIYEREYSADQMVKGIYQSIIHAYG